MENGKQVDEKVLHAKNGWGMLLLSVIGIALGIILCILSESIPKTQGGIDILLIAIGVILIIVFAFLLCGLKIVNPNEAIVLTLFGKYYGTIKKEGFFWVNPFSSSFNPAQGALMGLGKKISLKAMTLNNEKQKDNDEEGNPIEIGVVVIWKVVNTARAVFDVDNYVQYISTQCDAAIRQVARQYPYDVSENGDEKSLRGSSVEIAEILRQEIQTRVEIAGIEICEARIAHLAYAPEIAAAMLQRQQASAIIAARQKIVDGAVSMVEMALNKLSENGVVELDEERKAAMVSNLLVVLCGNKDAQPVVNSGSLY